MSQVTELATTQINTTAAVTVELVEARKTPAVVIVTWPVKATVLHPRRFPRRGGRLRMFATASTELSRIKAGRKL